MLVFIPRISYWSYCNRRTRNLMMMMMMMMMMMNDDIRQCTDRRNSAEI